RAIPEPLCRASPSTACGNRIGIRQRGTPLGPCGEIEFLEPSFCCKVCWHSDDSVTACTLARSDVWRSSRPSCTKSRNATRDLGGAGTLNPTIVSSKIGEAAGALIENLSVDAGALRYDSVSRVIREPKVGRRQLTGESCSALGLLVMV